MASKKAGGSSSNGRKSIAKRLGIKAHGSEFISAGSIIVRQRGTQFHPGNNVGIGKDHTIFAMIDGFVSFRKGKENRQFIDILAPVEVAEQGALI